MMSFTSFTFYLIFIPILTTVLLLINFLFASHLPYQEKGSTFECGFHSFLGQNRVQFNIVFFVYCLLFLLFDIEILLVFPYIVSSYLNGLYGLAIVMIFLGILTLGFIFELGKGALKLESRQTYAYSYQEYAYTSGKTNIMSSSRFVLILIPLFFILPLLCTYLYKNLLVYLLYFGLLVLLSYVIYILKVSNINKEKKINKLKNIFSTTISFLLSFISKYIFSEYLYINILDIPENFELSAIWIFSFMIIRIILKETMELGFITSLLENNLKSDTVYFMNPMDINRILNPAPTPNVPLAPAQNALPAPAPNAPPAPGAIAPPAPSNPVNTTGGQQTNPFNPYNGGLHFTKDNQGKYCVSDPLNTAWRGYIDPNTNQPFQGTCQPYASNLAHTMEHDKDIRTRETPRPKNIAWSPEVLSARDRAFYEEYIRHNFNFGPRRRNGNTHAIRNRLLSEN